LEGIKMKKIIKLIVTGVVIASLAAGLAGCGSNKRTVDNVKKSKKLVVGTNAGFAPFEFQDPKTVTNDMLVYKSGNKTFAGFDIALANEIAKDMGAELVVEDMVFDNLLGALNAGKIDMILAGYSPKPERKKTLDFSELYYSTQQSLLVKKEDKDKYKAVTELKGVKVGVQRGSIQETIATTDFAGAEVTVLDQVPDLVLALNSNKVDAVLVEAPVATPFTRQYPSLAVSSMKIENTQLEKGEEDGYGVAVQKGSDLVNSVNNTIERLKKEGKLESYFEESLKMMQ
jgi:polar amino acid transport system substrate-binding protein